MRGAGLDAALKYIEDTFAEQDERSQLDVGADPVPKAVPNNDTFCAVFRGIFHDKGRDLGAGTSVEAFGKVTSAMMTADVFVGPKIMTYGLDLFLMDGELESVRSHGHLPSATVITMR
ncbi:MAG: hypothetical protein HC767_06315 [Akkermansiaceae bacterium]|nr:hypothetical protein [Akkermansiaceae bacterium]